MFLRKVELKELWAVAYEDLFGGGINGESGWFGEALGDDLRNERSVFGIDGDTFTFRIKRDDAISLEICPEFCDFAESRVGLVVVPRLGVAGKEFEDASVT